MSPRSARLPAMPARTLLAATIALAFAGPALAETAPQAVDFDTVVVTASGFEQKITDAPASISVVTVEELRTRPYLTLIDAVRELEGVDVGETSDKTGQRTISMRGMGPDYTLVLIDGKRQNNHGDIYPNNFGGNQFNHIPPLDAIDRIEVIRGPASTLYGADALGGVINIITKPVTEYWTGSASISHNVQENSDFGADSTFDFAVSGPLVADVLGLNVRGSWYERNASTPEYEIIHDPDGEPHERTLGFGGGGKTVDSTSKSAGLTLAWQISDQQDLSLDYDISRQSYDNTPFVNNLGTLSYPLGTVDNVESLWRDAPRVGYIAEQAFDRDNWSLTHRGGWEWGNSFVSLAHVETSNHGRTLPFTVAERLQHIDMYCDGVDVCGTGPYAGMTADERQALMEETFLPRPGRNMESSQYTLDAKLDIPMEGWGGYHHFVVGGQLIDGELDDGVFGMEGGDDGAGVVQDHRMWSLFAEDNWNPIDPLTITFGLRHDDHNVFGSQLSPRVYGIYEFSPAWTLKGGVSTGYKTPKTTDLYDGVTGFGGQGTSPFVGNPDLQPETSVNSEVALYWTSADNRHNFNATIFRNDFKDKIARGETNLSCEQTGGVRPCANLGDYALLGYTTYAQRINIDEVRIQGAELAGRWGMADTLSLRANYTFTDSEQLSGPQQGLPLTNTARHMANATLNWDATDYLSLQLTAEARSKRYRDVIDGVRHDYEDYTVFHLGAQYRFNEYVTINARINNLLDEDFTTFQTVWIQDPDSGAWSPTYLDDYNNKDKSRNLWLGLNVRF